METQTIEKTPDSDVHADVMSALREVEGRSEQPSSAEPKTEEPKAPEPKIEAKQPLKPAEKTEERLRDESGRFTKADPKTAPEAKSEAIGAQPQPQATEKPKPFGNPPASWSVQAKSQWDRLPGPVRDEINKASAAPATNPDIEAIKPYLERAQQSGQSLASALQAYTGIEDLLRRDPFAGHLQIAQNLGFTQHQAGQFFAQLAHRLGAFANGQPPAAQNGHAPQLAPELAPILHPLMQRIDALDGQFRQHAEALQGQRESAALSAIEQFRQSPEHRYYDNLEGQIGDLLEKGVVPRTGDYAADLKTAYDYACRLDPEVSEILAQERLEKLREEKAAAERQAAEKARAASRSVTGSPSPGANAPVLRRPGQSYDEDLINDVTAAVRSASGRA